MEIIEALSKLDHENDDHWTSAGLPQMSVIEELVGDESITRKDVSLAAPDFKRGEELPEPKKEEPKPVKQLSLSELVAHNRKMQQMRAEKEQLDQKHAMLRSIGAMWDSLTDEEKAMVTGG